MKQPDVLEYLEDAYSFLMDPAIGRAIDEIKRLRKKITEMETAQFMHDVIGKANWNQVCKENDVMRKALLQIGDYAMVRSHPTEDSAQHWREHTERRIKIARHALKGSA